MTNNELLEIIKVAEESKVNHDTLRRLLKILENSEGRVGKLKYLKKLLKEKNINEDGLLSIFERVYAGKNVSWESIVTLNNHLLLKNHIMNTEYTKEELNKVTDMLDHLLKKEEDGRKDRIYIRELRNLKLKESPLEEYDFLNTIYISFYNCELINSSDLFSYLLNEMRPLEERKQAFRLLKSNVLAIYREVKIEKMEEKAKKILETYDLYGFEFANTYATLITCILDMDVPKIEEEEERKVYYALYRIMIWIDADKRFLSSYYYHYLINTAIPASEREVIAIFLSEKELILKDKLVKILIEIYREKGLDILKQVKYALLNNGIRTNPLSKKFLFEERDLETLKLARKVLKENGVRKRKDDLARLGELKTKEEKIQFLHHLKAKYTHEIDPAKEKEEKERKRTEAEIKLNTDYTRFVNKKIGLSTLKESLDALTSYDIELTRIRRKTDDGRKI